MFKKTEAKKVEKFYECKLLILASSAPAIADVNEYVSPLSPKPVY